MRVKNIKGYEGLYSISDTGEVRRIFTTIIRSDGKKKRFKARLLKSLISSHGYFGLRLSKNSITEQKYIHRLIAEHFIPNPKKLDCINHKDGNKLNNSISNLEWCTKKYNNQHAYRTGLNTNQGETHNAGKLKKIDVRIIREALSLNHKASNIARYFKVRPNNISNIKYFKIWKIV